jgi:hypothetical protein
LENGTEAVEDIFRLGIGVALGTMKPDELSIELVE